MDRLLTNLDLDSRYNNGALFPPNKAGPVTSKKPGLASHQRRKLDFAQKKRYHFLLMGTCLQPALTNSQNNLKTNKLLC